MGTNDTKEIAPLAGEAKIEQLNSIRDQYRGESRTIQARRILEALRLFPISTLEARRHLDIMHPAGRVQELRDDGHVIDTLRLTEESDIGRPHNVAVYVLRREARP
jgi:hypothetical protein